MIGFSLLLFAASAGAADLPPKELLHVGEKKVLEENAAAGTVPIAAWDQFVMGEGTTWKLPPYRRGLYGGTDLGDLEKYGAASLATGKAPWVMKIILKDECLSEAASTGTFYDTRFTAWVMGNVNEILKQAPQCLQAGSPWGGDTANCDMIFTGANFLGAEAENDCDRLLTRFLQESGARVVKDAANFDSWYVRDRACIEKIEADPLTVLKAAARGTWDLKTKTAGGAEKALYGAPFFSILAQALAEADAVPSDLLTELEGAAGKSDVYLEESPGGAGEGAGAGKQFFLKETVPALVAAYRRCEGAGKQAAFRAAWEGIAAKDSAAFLEGVGKLRGRAEALCL